MCTLTLALRPTVHSSEEVAAGGVCVCVPEHQHPNLDRRLLYCRPNLHPPTHLTQVDILSSGKEVVEVVEFVRQNAERLLGVETPRVLPVSSRAAMEAKIAAADGNGKVACVPVCVWGGVCNGVQKCDAQAGAEALFMCIVAECGRCLPIPPRTAPPPPQGMPPAAAGAAAAAC